jgi:ubiquinone/menaquinone biosynthesis C-methylase UbiE
MMKAALHTLLNRFPRFKTRLKRLHRRFISTGGVSSNYISLSAEEVIAESTRLRDSWRNDALPHRQRKLVDQQLRQYRSGGKIDVFDVFVDILSSLPNLEKGASLLDVGCSSGFYSEVIEISGMPIRYSGCDYSEGFIELARVKYPLIDFAVEDATNLSYSNNSFDIVLSGCCLLHIPNYAMSIEETARVARSYAIFHRTPVVWGQPEQRYRKQAYEVETVEIHFNEQDFLGLLSLNGLELISTHTLSEEIEEASCPRGFAIRTYLCKKKDQ